MEINVGTQTRKVVMLTLSFEEAERLKNILNCVEDLSPEDKEVKKGIQTLIQTGIETFNKNNSPSLVPRGGLNAH